MHDLRLREFHDFRLLPFYNLRLRSLKSLPSLLASILHSGATMDAIRHVRGLVAGGPPYTDDIPRPVLEFLTAMGGDDDCSDDSPEDSRYVFLPVLLYLSISLVSVPVVVIIVQGTFWRPLKLIVQLRHPRMHLQGGTCRTASSAWPCSQHVRRMFLTGRTVPTPMLSTTLLPANCSSTWMPNLVTCLNAYWMQATWATSWRISGAY